MSKEKEQFGNKGVDYTVGFMFDNRLERVALIRKVGGWQDGKLNGIGGKRKKGESFKAAHVREFQEETSYLTNQDDWMEFATIRSLTSKIVFYTSYGDMRLIRNPEFERTGEETIIKNLDDVTLMGNDDLNESMVDNLPWLICLARNRLKEPRLAMVKAYYCGHTEPEQEKREYLLREARQPFGEGEL